MKGAILAVCVLLVGTTGCSSLPTETPFPRELDSLVLPSAPRIGEPRSDEVVFVFDSRMLRALRNADAMTDSLGLTRGQKIALWTTVGVVGAFVVADWLEDNVAFGP